MTLKELAQETAAEVMQSARYSCGHTSPDCASCSDGSKGTRCVFGWEALRDGIAEALQRAVAEAREEAFGVLCPMCRGAWLEHPNVPVYLDGPCGYWVHPKNGNVDDGERCYAETLRRAFGKPL